MPLFLKYVEDSHQWGIWKTDEPIEELLTMLPNREWYEEGLQRFAAVHRRLEWLSVRILLYTLLGEDKEIAYYSTGKPYLSDHSYHISISHTRGYVAVILSRTAEVGIDIEQYGERAHRVAHKFMRDDEIPSMYSDSRTWSLLLHWSAKEVMIKCLNTTEIILRKHLHVYPFQVQKQGILQTKEYRTDRQQDFSIHYLIRPEFVIAWWSGE
jgi:phosphopantetheinyl transferase